jgi:hypothetical protein
MEKLFEDDDNLNPNIAIPGTLFYSYHFLGLKSPAQIVLENNMK